MCANNAKINKFRAYVCLICRNYEFLKYFNFSLYDVKTTHFQKKTVFVAFAHALAAN